MVGQSSQKPDDLICVGLIGSPRGLKGELRVKSFTAMPEALGDYGALTDEMGEAVFELKVTGKHKEQMVVRIQGVNDRTAAEALNGQKLYVSRDQLPDVEEDEYYFSDLVGLNAQWMDGTPFGQVVQAEDYGGGPFIEIKAPGHGNVLVPFTKAAVPLVDVQGGKIVIDPPEGLLDPAEPEPQDGDPEGDSQ